MTHYSDGAKIVEKLLVGGGEEAAAAMAAMVAAAAAASAGAAGEADADSAALDSRALTTGVTARLQRSAPLILFRFSFFASF